MALGQDANGDIFERSFPSPINNSILNVLIRIVSMRRF